MVFEQRFKGNEKSLRKRVLAGSIATQSLKVGHALSVHRWVGAEWVKEKMEEVKPEMS
jgi:hypothetical protein